jgi:ornithine cyclodeaminase/alanine dehydrogenase-like protein (mu-crystallin family)
MLVVSAETGFLKGVLLDNGYLTQVRTGAAGAVAAKYLAPENTDPVGVIGSGVQARFQMAALKLVRPFSTIHMFSLDADEEKDRYVRDMQAQLDVTVVKAPSVEAVVRESAVVVTTTPSRRGFIEARPGCIRDCTSRPWAATPKRNRNSRQRSSLRPTWWPVT